MYTESFACGTKVWCEVWCLKVYVFYYTLEFRIYKHGRWLEAMIQNLSFALMRNLIIRGCLYGPAYPRDSMNCDVFWSSNWNTCFIPKQKLDNFKYFLKSLKCHFLDFEEYLTEFWWPENSVLVCRNLQFSSTIWAKAYLINYMLDKLQESMGNIFIFFAVCHG
jgi:hypothetical protein